MLETTDLHKTFSEHKGAAVKALDGVSLTVPEGRLFTILGASGSGKTTMLRSIAGLERPDAGRIVIGGRPVLDTSTSTFVPPHKRGLGMVFQSYAIWPHMTVAQNVAFPLQGGRSMSRRDVKQAVQDALELMQMGHLAERPATLLSGGQQQRLALARAIVGNPRLLLLDEPLSNLDAKLRERMRFELKRLQRETGITTIYVTHDQTEALALSDEIALMHDGQIVQLGTPSEIYYRPADEYVADFIGSTNLLHGRLVSTTDGLAEVEVAGRVCHGAPVEALTDGEPVSLAVRPEAIVLGVGGPADADHNVLEGVVRGRVFLGENTEFLVDVDGMEVRVRASGAVPRVDTDDRVTMTFPVDGCHVFARERLDEDDVELELPRIAEHVEG